MADVFSHGGPNPVRVRVRSHDGRVIEVEREIVDALGYEVVADEPKQAEEPKQAAKQVEKKGA